VPEVRQQSSSATVEHVRLPDLEKILTIPPSLLLRGDELIQ